MKDSIRPGGRRLGGGGPLAAIGVLALVALLAWLLWPSGDGTVRTERFVTEIEMITPPPPPPPEPDDPIMEEEEEIVEPSEEPPSETPTEEPVDQPQDTPTETETVPSQLAGLDRPADAGSDTFRLAAGGGGGLFGRGTGGGGGGDWGSYVEGHIRRALQRDPRTRAARGSLRVQVTIAEDGRFTGARLRSSTGDPELDEAVRRVLENLPRLSVRRPQDRPAETLANIDMKRS